MKQVWKYDLLTLTQRPPYRLSLPAGAKILCLQVQHGIPRVWVEVDPANPRVTRLLFEYATGQTLDQDGLVYVGTYQTNGGTGVWHVYEKLL